MGSSSQSIQACWTKAFYSVSERQTQDYRLDLADMFCCQEQITQFLMVPEFKTPFIDKLKITDITDKRISDLMSKASDKSGASAPD